MKRVFKIALMIVIALSSLKADAAIYSDSQIKSIIAKQVLENYKEYTDAELSVNVVTLPFKDLELPNGKVSFIVTPSMDRFLARDLEKVSVYVNDKFVESFNAPVVVKAYQDVLVASRFINIGQQINASAVTVKRLEISNKLGYQLSPDSLGKEILAKKAFREGEIVDKRFVKQRPEIVRNSSVTVFFNTNNLTISTEAISLSDGTIGDTVCLMNKNYNRTYKGKVIGENKVLVKI